MSPQLTINDTWVTRVVRNYGWPMFFLLLAYILGLLGFGPNIKIQSVEQQPDKTWLVDWTNETAYVPK
jgi:hypothetical protein